MGECRDVPLDPQPDPEDPRWLGRSPTAGELDEHDCVLRAATQDELLWSFVGYTYFTNAGGVAVPPDYGQVVETYVTQERVIPDSTVHFGPKPVQIAVKIPVWLWIEAPPVADLNLLGGAVSARIHVDSTVWSMGESWADPDVLPRTPVKSFTCAGTGSPPPTTSPSPTEKAPCGYTYAWRSTKERVGSTCAWPVVVTVNWRVDWTAGGQTGNFTVPLQVDTGARVGEWRAVLVDPNSPMPANDPSTVWADCSALPGS